MESETILPPLSGILFPSEPNNPEGPDDMISDI